MKFFVSRNPMKQMTKNSARGDYFMLIAAIFIAMKQV
jgi:hypothetical protein